MIRTKKILITGATGFIGKYVVQELLENNCTVIASSTNEEKAKQASWYADVTYIPFDLKTFDDSIDYFLHFGKPDAMIHLTWEGLPNYNAAFHVEENLPRHLSFLSNMINYGLKDLTVTGTCFEYGMNEGCLREDMEAEPANPYAAAKDQLRKSLEIVTAQKQVHFKWLRLFYMYGKGQSPNSLFSQLDKALEDNDAVFNMSGGEQERDYLRVEEVAANIVKIALQHKVEGIINCCSGKPVKIKDMVQQYLASTKQIIELNQGFYPYSNYEPMRFWGDNEKLKTIIHDE